MICDGLVGQHISGGHLWWHISRFDTYYRDYTAPRESLLLRERDFQRRDFGISYKLFECKLLEKRDNIFFNLVISNEKRPQSRLLFSQSLVILKTQINSSFFFLFIL